MYPSSNIKTTMTKKTTQQTTTNSPYAVILIGTHGEYKHEITSSTNDLNSGINTFTIPNNINLFKIDAVRPGICYEIPNNVFVEKVEQLIRKKIEEYSTKNRQNAFELLKHELTGNKGILKQLDTKIRNKDGLSLPEYYDNSVFYGYDYPKNSEIYNKSYFFNSDEVQITNDFKIHFFSSEKGDADVTNWLFKTPNFFKFRNKKEHKTDLHSVLNVLHQPYWLPQHYNVILIDLTCSPIADHNNRLYDSQDRISRTTVRDIIKNTSSYLVNESLNK